MCPGRRLSCESVLPLATSSQGDAEAPGSYSHGLGVHSGFWQWYLTACAPFPSLHGGAGPKGMMLVVLGAVQMLTATPQHPRWWFHQHLQKLLKGKENFVHSSSSSFPLALVSSHRAVSSCAVSMLPRGNQVGVGLRLCLGIVLIKLVYVKKQ